MKNFKNFSMIHVFKKLSLRDSLWIVSFLFDKRRHPTLRIVACLLSKIEEMSLIIQIMTQRTNQTSIRIREASNQLLISQRFQILISTNFTNDKSLKNSFRKMKSKSISILLSSPTITLLENQKEAIHRNLTQENWSLSSLPTTRIIPSIQINHKEMFLMI